MKTFSLKIPKRTRVLTAIIALMAAGTSVSAATYYVSNTSNSGLGSLRQAIFDANGNSGADIIEFSTSGTITLSSLLPYITDPVAIRGYTATSAAPGAIGSRTITITVDGGNTTSTPSGRSSVDGLFRFTSGASGSSISGLSIINTGADVEAILVEPGASNIHIWGNYIGVNASGTHSSSTRIGDDAIMIGVPNPLSSAPAAISNITIGTNGDGTNDANEGNVIANTNRSLGGDGIQVGAYLTGYILTVSSLKISGNYIGLRPDGTTVARIGDDAGSGSAGGSGILFNDVDGKKILVGTNGDGTSDALERNIISGCALSGIVFNGSNNVDISGNYIGTDKTGTISKPNANNTSNSWWDGITIVGERRSGTASLNRPDYNINIGFIDSLHSASVATVVRNVISGNNGNGISAQTNSDVMYPQTRNVSIAGNYIGVDVTGNTALGNGQNSILQFGNGVYMINVKNFVVGTNGNGTNDALEGNVISGNLWGVGVRMSAASFSNFPMKDSRVSGNKIGVGADGATALGNDASGVRVEGATNIIIGSDDNNTSDALEANIIANNAFGYASSGGSSDGVRVTDTATKIRISRNIFYHNKANPIDLANDAVSVNDGTTTTGQPNLLLDYPVFTSYSISGSTMTVSGYVGACDGTQEYNKGTVQSGTLTVQVYKVDDDGDQNGALTNNGCSRSTNHGEGKQYLGSITVTGGAFTNASFTLVSGASFTASDKLTGITIDANGNTSEFGVTTLLKLSGNVFDDANGNTTIQSPSEVFSSLPQQLYVYLVNQSTGIVMDSAKVAPNGSYDLSAEANTNYTLQLSKVSYPIGTNTGTTPINKVPPTDWVTTGENKTNNSGSGDGSPDGVLPISVATSSMDNLNFGIEHLPNSQNVTVTIATPSGNSISQGTVTNIAANAVAGTDPEDGTLGNSKTIVITKLPTNGVMSYNGSLVTLNQQITNFDPSKLSFSSLNTGTTSTNFEYAFLDAASKQDPSPAVYTINWPGSLPIVLSTFDVQKVGATAQLSWTTAKEEGVAGFTIERSGNGNQWIQIGFEKTVNDRSVSAQDYKFDDVLPMQGQNFYRLKIVEKDGKQSYSMVRSLLFGSNSDIKVYPNPVQDKLMLTGLTGTSQIVLSDISGRVVYQAEVSTNSTVVPFNTLPAGGYQLKIVDGAGTVSTHTLMKK